MSQIVLIRAVLTGELGSVGLGLVSSRVCVFLNYGQLFVVGLVFCRAVELTR